MCGGVEVQPTVLYIVLYVSVWMAAHYMMSVTFLVLAELPSRILLDTVMRDILLEHSYAQLPLSKRRVVFA